MSEIESLQRKIKLKRQTIPLIKVEIEKDQIQLALLVYQKTLEAQIGKKYDPVLSRKLDCLVYLIEN